MPARRRQINHDAGVVSVELLFKFIARLPSKMDGPTGTAMSCFARMPGRHFQLALAAVDDLTD